MNEKRLWNGRRYYSLDAYFKQTFGEKLYKLSLDSGMGCPNRDGTISYGGCIFCSEGGSGDFAVPRMKRMDEQIEYAKTLVSRKYTGSRYIAYFQSYTNTYADVDELRKLFFPVIQREDIAGLSIATRPDCLQEDKMALIAELASVKPVWVELGLQTIHQKTAELINRGYQLDVYDNAVFRLKQAGADVITHMIVGLPGETKEEMLATTAYIGQSGSDGIKIQLLHVLKNTKLYEMYELGEFKTLEEDEYVSLVADIIAILPPHIVIHRLTGDGDKSILVSPKWSGDKRRVLNKINHELKCRQLYQGCCALVKKISENSCLH